MFAALSCTFTVSWTVVWRVVKVIVETRFPESFGKRKKRMYAVYRW